MSREEAYKTVQKNALDAFETHGNFKMNLENDEEIKKYLSLQEIEACFNTKEYLKNIKEIYERFNLPE